MNDSGDVFTTLGWGLRRYAWVVVLFVVFISALVVILQRQATDVYQAEAQVGPTNALNLSNLTPLPRFGDTVFHNGAVQDSVRNYLGLPKTASVVPSRVDVVAAQDNIVFVVIGRGPTPQSASRLANLAAATFTLELNKYSQSVGEFTIQRAADVPATPVSSLRGGYVATVLGVLAGLIAGVGAVALILVLRRPVVDAATAEGVTGVPVIGRIRLPRSGKAIDEHDVMGIGLLCRRLLSTAPQVILLASPPKGQVQLRQLAAAIRAFLTRIGEPAAERTSGLSRPQGMPPSDIAPDTVSVAHHPQVILLDGPSLERWARRPDETQFTLLVVPEGIGARALRNTAYAYLTGDPAGLVIVVRGNRRHRLSRRGPVTAQQRELAQATSAQKKQSKKAALR
jgi:capsular polysaccharide biosynthesis protein